MNRSSLRRVVVIPNLGIGDFILSFPLLHRIKVAFPRAHLTAVVHGPTNLRIAGTVKWIDECLYIPQSDFLELDNEGSMIYLENVKRTVTRADLTVCLVEIPFYKEVVREIEQKKILLFTNSFLKKDERILDGFGRMLDGFFGWEDPGPELNVPVDPMAANAVRSWRKKRGLERARIACLIAKAGTGERELKDIPPETVIRLAASFSQAGLRPCLLLPPGEGRTLYRSLEGRDDLTVADFPDILQALAFVHGADYVAGPDTGFMHFAALAGKRVLSLFGHTEPVFYPAGRKVSVIDKGGECDSRRMPVKKCCLHEVSCIGKVTVDEIADTLRDNGPAVD